MKGKLTFIFFILVLLFSAVTVKAFYVQVVNRSKLIAYSESQVLRTKKVFPKRGQILDRNSNPLAINVKRYNLFTFAKDTNQTIRSINKLKKLNLNLNISNILATISKRKQKFTWIGRQINLTAKQVEYIQKLDEVNIEEEFARIYPNHELASQLIGFVGIDNSGLSGIEHFFNDDLTGKAQVRKYYKDAKGRPVKFDSDSLSESSKDITLSIDKSIQASLETALKDGVIKHEAYRGGAAVMDARTGEIWAIANYPTFDPNEISNSNPKDRKLSFVTDPFEPGSVFKSLTIASALENNIVKPDTNYFCEKGKYRVQNHTIKESDSSHGFEWLSVKDILKYSSNIGTTKIAFDLTYPTLKKTLAQLHIGEKLDVEIKGESRGILEEKDDIGALRLSNISFGQGVATTGIQMLASYAPFANGGYFVRPTFLKRKSKPISDKVLSENTINDINDMLVAAVEDGTGSNAKVKYFTIAGKTSTAQRIDETGKYNGYTSGFIGYPLNVDKKFIIFVYIENPKKGYYGNTVAAPIFQKIASSILYKKKEYSKLAKTDAKSSEKSMDSISYKSSSLVKTKEGTMPNLEGLDKSSVIRILNKINIDYNMKGFGVVSEQYPKPGESISKNTIVKLIFKAPDYE